ncbi:MAG TPA: zf-HC2 domain-containing protein [Pyrinomonadaceae bacterium]|nr:zf-HC2 domain-containing protein [Pyrinomonadaceae bacterium]
MEAIGQLIHERLNCPPDVATAIYSAAHLDEDALGAFVEGRLSEDESATIVSHLLACESCRSASARLIRLESFPSSDDEVTIPEDSPSRLRQWLDSLASQVVPSSGEDAVFAYQNPDTDQEADDLSKPKQNDSATEPEK